MNALNLSSRIAACWEARLNRRIESSLLQHAQILAETGLPFGKLTADEAREAIRRGAEFHLILEIALLSVSLARAQSRYEEAKLWHTQLREVCSACGEPPGFRYFHEAGLNLLAVGDHFGALENFTKSIALSKNSVDEAYAKVNTLLCFESLGLPCNELEQELETRLPLTAEPVLEAVRTTFEAFRRRQLFRRGSFAYLIGLSAPEHEPLDQSRYFLHWVKSLPFIAGATEGALDLRPWTQGETTLFQKSYLLRTLLGQLHPDDQNGIKVSDQIERLYLWTWRWLVDPKGFPFSKIATLLRSWSHWMEDDFRLSSEDRKQLRNALHWIAIFDSGSVDRLLDQLRSLDQPRSALDAPWLDFEFDCLRTLLAQKQGSHALVQEFLQGFRLHPLWSREDQKMSALLLTSLNQPCSENSSLSPGLASLAGRLREICYSNPSTDQHDENLAPASAGSECELRFDPSNHEIVAARGQLRIHSEPLCQALSLLSRQSSVSFEKFVLLCFQIRKYDKLIHQAKVFNLVARLRTLLPKGCEVRSKNGVLYAIGDWSVIRQKNADDAILQVTQARTWAELKVSRQRPVSRQRFLAGQTLTRQEFQQLTGRPTSTATRTLTKLVSSGKLSRIGNSRRIQYEVKKDFSL